MHHARRTAAALDGPAQRRRRAFHEHAPVRAARNGQARGRRRRLRPLLHGRPRHAAGKRRGFHRGTCSARSAASAWAGSRPFPAATTPWIATSAGSGSSGPRARWSTASARKRPTRWPRSKRSYEHGVTDEFIEPVTIVDARNEPVGSDPRRATRACSSTIAPTAAAR